MLAMPAIRTDQIDEEKNIQNSNQAQTAPNIIWHIINAKSKRYRMTDEDCKVLKQSVSLLTTPISGHI